MSFSDELNQQLYRLKKQGRNRLGYLAESDGYPLHRRKYEEVFGELPRDWPVHHIDRNKDNNELDNLIGLPRAFHKWLHLNNDDYDWFVKNGVMNRDVIGYLLECYQGKKFRWGRPLRAVLLELCFIQFRTLDEVKANTQAASMDAPHAGAQ